MGYGPYWQLCISSFSKITQVIIEILAPSLVENGIIFRYNQLQRGDYSRRINFENGHLALCQCVWRENGFRTDFDHCDDLYRCR